MCHFSEFAYFLVLINEILPFSNDLLILQFSLMTRLCGYYHDYSGFIVIKMSSLLRAIAFVYKMIHHELATDETFNCKWSKEPSLILLAT